MEIKATLKKPYDEKQRIDFIIENNHKKGYEIKETSIALEAWGNTDNEIFEQAKEAKKLEASNKAYEYIENGAMFEFAEGKHIEANDGNISKLGLAAIELVLNQDLQYLYLFEIFYAGKRKVLPRIALESKFLDYAHVHNLDYSPLMKE